MAIYHLSVKPVSRGVGRSATAAAAYRSASQVADRTTGQVFDYTRKSGVEHSEIVLPTEIIVRRSSGGPLTGLADEGILSS